MRRLAGALCWFAVCAAHADTAMRFEAPRTLGTVEARVLDETGARVGSAQYSTTRIANGGLRVRAVTRLDSGIASEMDAVLAPAERRDRFKLVREHSQTFTAGRVLAVDVRIDHRALRARCGGAASEGGSLALAPTARLANTPIQLLLPPLATSRERELEVENVICRGAPRLMTMRAERKRTEPWPRRPRVVRVEYGPSGLLGALAGLVSARVSFWFDPADVSPWIAHRMPLEPGGRPVWVVREAVALPADLIPARN